MTTKTTSVALGDTLSDFARRKVQSGEFGSTSEVIRAGVRLLAERDARRAALEAAIEKGLESGPATPFDWDDFMERRFGNDT